jgi:hypothetical protein
MNKIKLILLLYILSSCKTLDFNLRTYDKVLYQDEYDDFKIGYYYMNYKKTNNVIISSDTLITNSTEFYKIKKCNLHINKNVLNSRNYY